MSDHYILTYQDQVRSELIQMLSKYRDPDTTTPEQIIEEAEKYYNFIFNQDTEA